MSLPEPVVYTYVMHEGKRVRVRADPEVLGEVRPWTGPRTLAPGALLTDAENVEASAQEATDALTGCLRAGWNRYRPGAAW